MSNDFQKMMRDAQKSLQKMQQASDPAASQQAKGGNIDTYA